MSIMLHDSCIGVKSYRVFCVTRVATRRVTRDACASYACAPCR